jgi:hypothetical protein
METPSHTFLFCGRYEIKAIGSSLHINNHILINIFSFLFCRLMDTNPLDVITWNAMALYL